MFAMEKVAQIWASCVIFVGKASCQNKHLPIGRKFAQSGHPDSHTKMQLTYNQACSHSLLPFSSRQKNLGMKQFCQIFLGKIYQN
jgi:hypothetical protein